MSSRNSFTSNYIYDPNVAVDLCQRLIDEFVDGSTFQLGWGITTVGHHEPKQVVGMFKNIEWESERVDKVRDILKGVKERHDSHDLTLVFISDEYDVLTTISTKVWTSNANGFKDQQFLSYD